MYGFIICFLSCALGDCFVVCVGFAAYDLICGGLVRALGFLLRFVVLRLLGWRLCYLGVWFACLQLLFRIYVCGCCVSSVVILTFAVVFVFCVV